MKLTRLILIWIFFSYDAQALNLQQFLNEVLTHNKNFRSLEYSAQATEARLLATDLDLVPVLDAKASYLTDQKQPMTSGTKIESYDYQLGVSKKFSSGTAAQVFARATNVRIQDMPSPLDKYATGSLGISLSQSLWKNFFGKSVSLRTQRAKVMSHLENAQTELKKRQFLIDAENTYWNYLYLLEEKKQRDSSLQRSEKILTWIRRRESDGISDRSDRLTSEALVATRKLFLLNTQDELTAAEQSIRDLLELDNQTKIPVLDGNLDVKRPIRAFFSSSDAVLRFDAYLALLDSQTKKIVAEEVEEGLKPDLSLQGSYNTNSFDSTMDEATKKWTNNNKPTGMISLNFTYLFDTAVKQASREAARKDFLASDLRSQRMSVESGSSWTELIRRYEELSKKITASELMSDLQMQRAKEEQLKLSKGRSITNNVITSEEDAANASLSLIKLKAEQRKLESQARNYIVNNQ